MICWQSARNASRFRRSIICSSSKNTNISCLVHIRRTSNVTQTMKRTADTKTSPQAKKPRFEVPDYHLTPSVQDAEGKIIWPAPAHQIKAARKFICECAEAKGKTLLVPDKDADGLSSGAILYRTLVLLGLPKDLISIHLVAKGSSIHAQSDREAMARTDPAYIFVLDQGSRNGPPVIDTPHKALIIDHHFAATPDDFPSGAQVVSACHSPPVATSALLTYEICKGLHPDIPTKCDWLCALGTHGDLGNTLKWEPPFPDMKAMFKVHTKKAINDAVAMVNAPRRTATFDVISAWDALLAADAPSKVLDDRRLHAAKAEVSAETERCTHTPPKFSLDGSVAVLRITSAAQVHPVIATRWSGHLKSPKLEIVMVANAGYLDGKVNFSCRIARAAKARGIEVDIIRKLENIAAEAGGDLRARLGESFAKGHVQASGGIVGKEEFEELMKSMGVGEKPVKTAESPEKKLKKKDLDSSQKNTITSYFNKK